MAFDFQSEIKKATARLTGQTPLFALVAGCSGSGKSTVCGTTGLKTVFICFKGEAHGPRNAAAMGGDITPIMADFCEDKELTADEAYTRLVNILDAPDIAAFGAIVLDGFPELENVIKHTTQFKQSCLTDKGKHDTWRESDAINDMLRPILDKLRAWNDKGKHVITTCRIDVKAVDPNTAAIEEATLKLSTYSIAENVVSKFDDVLVVGRMTNGSVYKWKFQFGTELTRISKDAQQNVKKYTNFNPRLSGLVNLPDHLDADLKQVITLKSKKKEEKK